MVRLKVAHGGGDTNLSPPFHAKKKIKKKGKTGNTKYLKKEKSLVLCVEKKYKNWGGGG